MRSIRSPVVAAVDVLIVGGGLQGLVLLRDVLAARYSCVLITKGPVASGQTPHSHGLLNSGAGLLTGSLEEELHTATLPYLRLLGVRTYGRTAPSSFFRTRQSKS